MAGPPAVSRGDRLQIEFSFSAVFKKLFSGADRIARYSGPGNQTRYRIQLRNSLSSRDNIAYRILHYLISLLIWNVSQVRKQQNKTIVCRGIDVEGGDCTSKKRFPTGSR